MSFDFDESESARPRYRQRSGRSWAPWFILGLLIAMAVAGYFGYAAFNRAGLGPGSEYEAAIRNWCQGHLNDPSDAEIFDIRKPQPITMDDGKKMQIVRAKIRARFPAGGKILKEYDFYFHQGRIIEAREVWE